ncbi:MAG TPA: hypothetical protein PK006_11670 [Saprospiraceae bacterium]|nr:hypothetical protein [Saprospiraceae bacterium]
MILNIRLQRYSNCAELWLCPCTSFGSLPYGVLRSGAVPSGPPSESSRQLTGSTY